MTRSEHMARVRQVDTAPEIQIRKELWRRGLRYRVAMRIAGVRPDVAFAKQRLAVFIDGCFWHGCPVHYTSPRSRLDFWSSKLWSNFERDRRQTLALVRAGWRVVRLWEHDAAAPVAATNVIVDALAQPSPGVVTSLHRVVGVDIIDSARDIERRVLMDLVEDSFREEIVGPRNSRSGAMRPAL